MRTLLLSLLLVACGNGPPAHAGHDQPPEHAGHVSDASARPAVVVSADHAVALGIRTVPARVGGAETLGRAPAWVDYDPLERTRITVQTGGQIRRLLLPRPGERVRAGARIAEVYEPSVVAAFEELQIAKELGAPWLEAARARLRAMGVPEADVRASVQTGKVPATFFMVAPRTGVVVERSVVEGAWLGSGGSLGVIADPAKVVVDLTISGEPPGPGVAVILRDAVSGEHWAAEVGELLPSGDIAGKRLRLVSTASIPVGRPLVAEWPLQTDVGVWVPRGALIDTGTRRVLFVAVGEGRFEPRQVVPGIRTADEVQILEGLKEGEHVVAAGTFLLDSETQIGGMGHAGHGG